MHGLTRSTRRGDGRARSTRNVLCPSGIVSPERQLDGGSVAASLCLPRLDEVARLRAHGSTEISRLATASSRRRRRALAMTSHLNMPGAEAGAS